MLAYRRIVYTLGVLVMQTAQTPAHAQTSLQVEQRNDIARHFSVPRSLASGKPNELSVLREIQENLIIVPSDASEYREYIVRDPLTIAIRLGLAPELGHLMSWHGLALGLAAQDHTVFETENLAASSYGEQLGPTRTSWAFAILHLAMFEAVNTIHRDFMSYHDVQSKIIQQARIPVERIDSTRVSVNAAIDEAAFNILVSIYPKKRSLVEAHKKITSQIDGSTEEARIAGQSIGREAAYAILRERDFNFADGTFRDGSELPDPMADDYMSADFGKWRKDPINPLKVALGGNWFRVKPFAIASSDSFRPTRPPPFKEAQFVAAFKEVKRLGGDPDAPTTIDRWPTPTDRTGGVSMDEKNETFKGIFWGYDGTAMLCAPTRLYNSIATSIALREKPVEHVQDMARLLALVNIAMADAAIAAWEAKFFYLYPRPVTVIRAIDSDNSEAGSSDSKWTPLGAPISNGKAENMCSI